MPSRHSSICFLLFVYIYHLNFFGLCEKFSQNRLIYPTGSATRTRDLLGRTSAANPYRFSLLSARICCYTHPNNFEKLNSRVRSPAMPLAARTCHTTCRTSGNLLKSACRPRQSLPPPASAAAAEGKRSVVPATAQQQHSSYHSSSHAAGSDSLVANKSGGGSYPRLHGVSRRAAADAGDGAPLLPLQQTLLLAAGPQGVRKFHTTTQRPSAHGPMSPSDLSTRKKVTINTLRKMYEKKEKISMVTAHDFPSGLLADQAGIDVVLVGDSLAMVGLGMEVSQLNASYIRI